MTKQALKEAALSYIEAHREELMESGRRFYSMPEPGYREVQTSAYMKACLEDCGLPVRDHIAMTGLKAKAEGKNHKANVCVMGELDSLIVPTHKKAQPGTGYFHGCGHHAQLMTVLGVAKGLVESGLISELDGDVTFVAVPAEEAVDLDYRHALIAEGKITYISGKQEMIHLGELEDVDMVLMSHMMGHTAEPASWCGHSWNGLMNKAVRYTGVAAHAGLAPERGINALEAAITGLTAVNALRERFHDEDHVRVHYIITKGGDSPNVVPDDVRLDLCVRAATMDALMQANALVTKALRLGGEAVGAGVEIKDYGLCLPCYQERNLGDLYLANASEILGENAVHNAFGEHRCSTTDCGDLAALMPMIHPYFGGAVGVPHGLDFDVVNDYAAYVVPAKLAAATVIDLLYDGAKEALRIKEGYTPLFRNKEEYFAYAKKCTGSL